MATQFTWITGELLGGLEVTDTADGTVTAFGEPAPYITTEELGRLAADYRALMADATAAVLCGQPPCRAAGRDLRLAGPATRRRPVSLVVLDASGSALRHAWARPGLVIPAGRPATREATREATGGPTVRGSAIRREAVRGSAMRR